MRPRLTQLSVIELLDLLSDGAIRPQELLDARMTAVRRNRSLNAFISVFGGGRSSRGRGRSALAGITIALKDNIYVKGHRTTAGSRVLRNFIPAFDADVVTRLRNAGASIIGKTNMHEFAFGVTNINLHFGDCRNPWKHDRISGGSSGGSAVAVASGMACAAVGTDTAGSVRIPASLCGVVGYKPTNGVISIRGVVPLAWSLDSVGFLTRSVADAALLAGLFHRREGAPVRARPERLKGVRIGLPRTIPAKVEPDVRRNYEGALDAAVRAGAKLVMFDFPDYKEALACRSLIVHAEAAAYHRRLFAERFSEYGGDLRRRLAQGLAIPAAVYIDALRARGRLIRGYRSLFGSMDLIAMPTTPISAPTIKASKGEESSAEVRSALLAYTEPFNVYGAPAISIPSGMSRDGLPTGLQLAGDIHSDQGLLAVAVAIEELLPERRHPND